MKILGLKLRFDNKGYFTMLCLKILLGLYYDERYSLYQASEVQVCFPAFGGETYVPRLLEKRYIRIINVVITVPHLHQRSPPSYS